MQADALCFLCKIPIDSAQNRIISLFSTSLPALRGQENQMPIKIQNDLPVKKILEDENIFVMDESRAVTQDIRPLERDG